MTDTQIQSRLIARRVVLGLVGVLCAGAVVGGLWIAIAPVSFWAVLTTDYSGADLMVDEAHQQAIAGDIVLIDIRRPDEWRATGIGDGAQPLDMRRKDFVQVLSAMIGNDLGTPVALICARGVRSARMSQRLAEAGFSAIIDVPEGMLGSRAGPGWLARDLPTYPCKEVSE